MGIFSLVQGRRERQRRRKRMPQSKRNSERIRFVCVGRGGRIAAAGKRNGPETEECDSRNRDFHDSFCNL